MTHSPRRREPGGVRASRRVIANLALLLGTIVLLLVLLEIGIRIFDPQPMRAFRFSTNTWYEPIPGARFTSQRSEYKQRIRYNSYGLRDRETTLEKPGNVTRIAVIGDSFTEALHVALEETFCERLEKRLNAVSGESVIEVINLGVGGFSTIQTLKRLDRDGFPFAPDWVLYLAHKNDFGENLSPTSRRLYTLEGDDLRLRDIEVSSASRWRHRIKDLLKRHVQTYTFLRARLQSLRRRIRPVSEGGDPLRGPNEAQLHTMRLALKKMQAMCEANSASLVASMVTPKEPMDPASWVPQFSDLCGELGIPFVDLTPAFQHAVLTGPPVFFQIDGHWNAEGHLVTAGVYEAYFREVLFQNE